MTHHDPANPATSVTPFPSVRLVPGALAGPGEPGDALDALQAAGWDPHDDELANTTWWSPDRLVCASFHPEHDLYDPQWTVCAYPEPATPASAPPPDPVWAATFDHDVPAEFVGAFLEAVVATHRSGIARDDRHDYTLLDPQPATVQAHPLAGQPHTPAPSRDPHA